MIESKDDQITALNNEIDELNWTVEDQKKEIQSLKQQLINSQIARTNLIRVIVSMLEQKKANK